MDFIHIADNALPGDLCDALMRCLDSHPGRHQGVTSAGVNPEKKSSVDLTMDNFGELQPLHQRILDATLEHLADYFTRFPFVSSINPTITDSATGTVMELTMDNIGRISRGTLKMLIARLFHCGTINIQKYPAGSGGYPHWHSEISPDESCDALHRVVFWMYYLNDVASGGETEFYYQKKAIRPARGRLVIAPADFTHTHRGNRPLSGDKYIITSWLLYNRGGKPAPAS